MNIAAVMDREGRVRSLGPHASLLWPGRAPQLMLGRRFHHLFDESEQHRPQRSSGPVGAPTEATAATSAVRDALAGRVGRFEVVNAAVIGPDGQQTESVHVLVAESSTQHRILNVLCFRATASAPFEPIEPDAPTEPTPPHTGPEPFLPLRTPAHARPNDVTRTRSIGVGFLALDADRIVVDISDEFVSAFGVRSSAAELIGKPASVAYRVVALQTQDPEACFGAMLAATLTNDPTITERVVSLDGRVLLLSGWRHPSDLSSHVWFVREAASDEALPVGRSSSS